MPTTDLLPVRELSLDLSNYRTMPQDDELRALQAMVAVHPKYFWGLMESIVDDGYLPVENIIVLRSSTNPSTLLVKEGNRRIAALKLIQGYLPLDAVNVPPNLQSKIGSLSAEWRTNNERVPCAIYPAEDALTVDRIVDVIHGKGETAGRVEWTAVARARHNRDRNQSSEMGLDLLEKYLREGRNITPQLAEEWAGNYAITVLDEAMPKIAGRLGLLNGRDLAQQYPNIAKRDLVEAILLDIGHGNLGFPQIRDTSRDFGAKYGLPPAAVEGATTGGGPQGGAGQSGTGASSGAGGSGAGSGTTGGQSTSNGGAKGQSSGGAAGTGGTGGTTGTAGAGSSRKNTGTSPATPMNDPRTVRKLLRSLKPYGMNRSKVVTLRDEMSNLNLEKNPIAFCFLLRGIFEVSAKAYCGDHSANGGPSPNKGGVDKPLAELLEDITNHLTNNGKDSVAWKRLYGAKVELAKKDGILSVTALNQLVHNPAFTISPTDICVTFVNIFPLLEAMNQ